MYVPHMNTKHCIFGIYISFGGFQIQMNDSLFIWNHLWHTLLSLTTLCGDNKKSKMQSPTHSKENFCEDGLNKLHMSK
jgi:hypothetical protein